MAFTVWLSAKTLYYPDAGGHMWAYLNWALGLRKLDCRVVWLEAIHPGDPVDEVQARVAALKSRLARYGLAESVALCSWSDEPLSFREPEDCIPLESASEAELLLNLAYGIPADLIKRFRRSAMLDYDPGLTQIWMSTRQIHIPRHDLYFTIGETVGQPGARFPDCGVKWLYTPPCVALDWWPVQRSGPQARFTTVSNWIMSDWVTYEGESYPNDKRTAFSPFLGMPGRTTQPLELALCLGGNDEERRAIQEQGWHVRESREVTAEPWDYQAYIQGSRGEFSCAKPSYVWLETAWISERTLCYLASGKPAIVQSTGPSRFLPESAGLFRFRDVDGAARALELVGASYDEQCRLARALAEEYFDARQVVGRLLERTLE